MNPVQNHASILPLRVEGLSFEAQGKTLLGDINFTIPEGGVTAIIGPNGSGKSLTLRLCHGLLLPSAGTVTWSGDEAMRMGHKKHAMVFQRPVMLRRSVRANLHHTLATVGRRDAATKTELALGRFGLQHLAMHPARLLSGGEQQRLALARAWSLEPDILFLDEPSSQLDPGATRQIEQMISELAGGGMTIVMSTHDLGQARRLSQRVLFLNQGKLLEDCETHAFFASPSTSHAQSFIAGDLIW